MDKDLFCDNRFYQESNGPISDPPTDTQLPAQISPPEQLLTSAEFQRLADVPPEVEWYREFQEPQHTRAYENAIKDFMQFTGIARRGNFAQ